LNAFNHDNKAGTEVSKGGSKTFEHLNDMEESVITIGVCCMKKKMSSKPMQKILQQLDEYQDLQII